MDTDELSEEAYAGILLEAELFNHDLTLQFGLLSYSCNSEEEYLSKAIELIQRIRNLSDYQLTRLFFGELPDIQSLNITLDKIIKNIETVNNIPMDKRTSRW